MRYLLLLAAVPLWGADDANQILRRFAEAEARNWEQARQYTCTETLTNFEFDKKGQPVQNGGAVREIIFVEGLEYKKLISLDGKPLDAKAQAKEDKRLRETAEQRRKERRSGLLHPVVSRGSIEEVIARFDNRLSGEEEIRGRKVWVVESTPPAGYTPANQHEKEVLSFQHKYWIDQTANFAIKTLDMVVGDHVFMKPGSTITEEYEKVSGDAWLKVSSSIYFHFQFAKLIRPTGRSDYAYTDFKKFDVKSTITMDPPK